MTPLESLLADHPFCAGMDDRHIELLASCAAETSFKPGDEIFREGDPAEKVFLILDGMVAVSVGGVQRGDLTIATVGDGELLGWSWLVPPYRKHFAARASCPTRAIVLDGGRLRWLCEQDTALGYALACRVAQVIAQRLQATRLQLLDLYAAHN